MESQGVTRVDAEMHRLHRLIGVGNGGDDDHVFVIRYALWRRFRFFFCFRMFFTFFFAEKLFSASVAVARQLVTLVDQNYVYHCDHRYHVGFAYTAPCLLLSIRSNAGRGSKRTSTGFGSADGIRQRQEQTVRAERRCRRGSAAGRRRASRRFEDSPPRPFLFEWRIGELGPSQATRFLL